MLEKEIDPNRSIVVFDEAHNIDNYGIDAYSVNIVDEIARVTGRKTKLGVVHSVLNRLEKKGLITSELGDPTKERGGRRKRFFSVSHAGKVTLMQTKAQRDRLWGNIPELVFQGIR